MVQVRLKCFPSYIQVTSEDPRVHGAQGLVHVYQAGYGTYRYTLIVGEIKGIVSVRQESSSITYVRIAQKLAMLYRRNLAC